MNSPWLFAVDLIAKVTLLLLVAMIANSAVRHRPAAIRHRIWCLTFCGLLCLPLLSCLLPQWNLPILPSFPDELPSITDEPTSELYASFSPPLEYESLPLPSNTSIPPEPVIDSDRLAQVEIADQPIATRFDASAIQPIEPLASAAETEIVPAEHPRPIPWIRIAAVTWMLGVFATFLPLLISEIRNRVLRRSTKDIEDGRGLVRQLSDELRLRRPVRWLESEQPVMPMTLGVIWPIVLFPDSWKQWSGSRQRLVLMHELAHVKRFDVAFQLIARVACTLYWFHPLVWYGLKRLRVERELACDDCVLMTGARPSQYASELLEIARQFPAISLSTAVAMAQSSNLEQRIGSMLDAARSHLPIGRTAARALVIATALFVTSVAVIKPATVADDTTAIEAEQLADQAADTDGQIAPLSVEGDQVADTVTVSGRVLLPSGKPASGATVRAAVGMWAMLEEVVGKDYELPTSETIADQAGRFSLHFSTQPYGDLSLLDERWQEIWKKTAIAASLPGYGGQWVTYEQIEAEKDNLVLQLVEDLPLRGRVVDLEGNPVADVNVDIGGIHQGEDNNIDPWLAAAKAGELPWTLIRKAPSNVDPKLIEVPGSLQTDARGSFQIEGIGKDRLLNLVFKGAGTARESVGVVMRAMEPIERLIINSTEFGDPTESVFGAELTITSAPSRPITGVVRDSATGVPLAGVAVESYKLAGKPYSNNRVLKTTTDQKGRYRLVGMPKADGNRIIVLPSDEQPYLIQQVDVPNPTGLDPVKLDVGLHRGIWITGRVTDKSTGEPVHARLYYLPYRSNLVAQALPEFTDGGNSHSDQTRYQTRPDGTYRLVGLPGAAVVGAESVHRDFRRGVGYSQMSGPKLSNTSFGYLATYRNPIHPNPTWPNVMKEIDVAEGVESVEVNFEMDPGRTVPMTTHDSDGNPLDGVEVTGVGSSSQSTRVFATYQFDAVNFAPDESRTMLFRKNDLGWIERVSASQVSGVTVRLRPVASLTGRLLHEDGRPLTGANIRAFPLPLESYSKQLPGVATDLRGRFRLDLLPGAAYSLSAEGAGIKWSANIMSDLSIEPGVAKDLGDFRLVGRNFEQVDQATTDASEANANAATHPEANPTGDTGEPLQYRGQVVDPDGNPVAGAKLYFVTDADAPKPEAVSDSQGRFRFTVDRGQRRFAEYQFPGYFGLVAVADGHGIAAQMSVVFEQTGQLWAEMPSNMRDYYRRLANNSKPILRLPKNDLPIQGRVVDSEGQPVENARVQLDRVWYDANGSLDQWEQAAKEPKADFHSLRAEAPLMLSGDRLRHLIPGVSTGADGRFTLGGIGNERVVHLLISARGLETSLVKARTRRGQVIDVPNSWDSRERATRREQYYGHEFSLVLPASVPIVGRLTDAETNEPIAGVAIGTARRRSFTLLGGEWPQTVTDDDGRYRLEGAPIGEQVVAVRPAKHQPYLPGGFSVTTKAGQNAKRLDCQLSKGIWVEGSTLDDRTGKPLAGRVEYFVDNGNEHRQRFQSYGRGNAFHQLRVTKSGEFSLPVMPGRGIITFMADGAGDFRRGVGAETISVPSGGIGMRGEGRSFSTRPYILTSNNANVLHEVNPQPGSDPVPVELVATSGTTVRGRLLGANGQPLVGGRVRADDSGLGYVSVDEETFEFQCRGYYPDRPRVINFVHIDKNLAARLELSGEAPTNLTVRLKPAARITGRLVDTAGAPLTGASLYGSNLVTRDHGATELRYATDDNGRFVLRGIVPGVEYDIRAIRDATLLGDVLNQFSVDSARTVDVGDIVPVHDHAVRGASTEVEAEPDPTVLRGKALGPDGKPMQSAQIWISGVGQTSKRWQGTRPAKVAWKRVAESDVKGRFEAKVESPNRRAQGNSSSLTVVATSAGLGFGSAEVELGSPEEEITLQLVDDVPISGQIVTAEGTPAPGVSIDIVTLPWELEDVEATVKSAPLSSGIYTNWPTLRGGPPGTSTVQTDSGGRFRLTGMGADRFVRLEAIGGGIGATRLKVITRQPPSDRLPSGAIAVREGLRESDYFASFVHIGPASRMIKGMVTDDVSGDPIEGVKISVYESWQARANPAVTDAKGHYELRGVPELAEYRMTFTATATAHLNKMQLPADPGGNEPLILDVSLHPGIVASGRLVDPETGKPVQGKLEYNPLFPNDNWSKLGKQRTANPASTASTDEDGYWRLGVLPGPGAIAVTTSDTRFVKARVKRSDLEALDESVDLLGDKPVLRILQPAAGDQTRGIMGLGQAVALVNPSPGSAPLRVEHKLVPGRKRSGNIVDPSGAPVLGVEAVGLGSSQAAFRPKKSADFEAAGLVQGRKKLLLFLQRERQLGGKLEVTGDELSSLTAQLTPTGTLTGRFVDKFGRPLSTASVRLSVHDVDGTLMMTGHWGANVDSDGRFRIEGLIPGVKYRVDCQVPEHRVALHVPAEVQVESGQTRDIGEFTKENSYRFKPVKTAGKGNAERR